MFYLFPVSTYKFSVKHKLSPRYLSLVLMAVFELNLLGVLSWVWSAHFSEDLNLCERANLFPALVAVLVFSVYQLKTRVQF